MSSRDFHRMFHWLTIAAALYAVAMMVPQPQVQTALWKLGHLTLGGFAGYWLDRNLLGRVDHNFASAGRMAARAVIVAACVLGMALGL